MAKQLSSGYLPAAGAIVRKDVADTFLGGEDEKFRHLYTYGGHPIAAAAALANLKIIEDEDLVENSAKMGQYLFERLQVLHRHSFVGDIRGGKGLFAAIELVKDRESKERFPVAMGIGDKITELLDLHDLLTRADNVIPILPPLITTSDDVDFIVEGIDRALSDFANNL
jgi:adenosylmethionine-8-amino-7-oxononanoate aminotransferase